MTPQAALAPALPVFKDSSLSPLPRSSVPCQNQSKMKLHGRTDELGRTDRMDDYCTADDTTLPVEGDLFVTQ